MRLDLPPTNLAEMLGDTLRDEGFLMLPGIVDPSEIDKLDAELAPAFDETPFCQGHFYGEHTKRFGGLLIRSPRAANFITHPLVLAIVLRVLAPYCDTIQLNLTQGLAIHPGAPAQFPHRDQDMWRGEIGRIEYLVNVMWPFTDYTAENGATRLWRGSHAPNGLDMGSESDPVVATMAPGSALMFLGSTLHGAGANHSFAERRGMIVSYCLGWLKPYENQWLTYPPAIARNFAPELAGLVGYRQHRPNLGNVDGRCPSLLLCDSPPLGQGATDALRPDQIAAVAAFEANQR